MENYEIIAKIKSAADIVRIFQQEWPSAPLQQRGQRFWACCPFHGERTPSFSISPEKQRFHCFGCDADGDVINLIAASRQISNSEAVKQLAAELGISRTELTSEERQRLERIRLEREQEREREREIKEFIRKQQVSFGRIERAMWRPDCLIPYFAERWRITLDEMAISLFGSNLEEQLTAAKLFAGWEQFFGLDIALLLDLHTGDAVITAI